MKINQALDFVSGVAETPDAQDGSTGQERGVRARERLLQEATRIFAEKGYAGASTREICQAAGQNVAAIHYYFGDKAGLHRATLLRPIEMTNEALAGFDEPGLTLEQALRRVMGGLLCLPEAGAPPDLEMRLFLREMLEPSGSLQDIVVQHIQPVHQRLVDLLARHTGASGPDDDLHQLAFALSAMVHDYCMSRPFMDGLAPGLLHGEGATERVLDRLVGYGVALVAHERTRRAGPHAPAASKD
jgi:AcrR family transcriptional regulator